VTYYQETIEILTPNPSWVEQDPNEILHKTILCIEKATKQLEELGYHKSDIKGIKKVNSI
jgi:glycerol kinase